MIAPGLIPPHTSSVPLVIIDHEVYLYLRNEPAPGFTLFKVPYEWLTALRDGNTLLDANGVESA
jgi:hypothetical protein